MDCHEKLNDLQKVYADVILNTTEEAAARIIVSEKKAVRLEHELNASKEQAVQMLLRQKSMMDCKKKEKLLKKKHRAALLLENVVHMDGFGPGHSRRDRKPVTCTFDDYDRSINEAIKITKQKASSPDSIAGEIADQTDKSKNSNMNGRVNGPVHNSQEASFDSPSPMSSDYDELLQVSVAQTNSLRQQIKTKELEAQVFEARIYSISQQKVIEELKAQVVEAQRNSLSQQKKIDELETLLRRNRS